MSAQDLVCFSHLRWDFVYQRPNHLMARAARDRRVFFVEEPVDEAAPTPHLRLAEHNGVTVVTPVLPSERDRERDTLTLTALVDHLVRSQRIIRPVVWYYTPMALPWTRHLAASAAATIYDSMDYLAGFKGAPAGLLDLEDELLARADVVFSGGASLHRRMAGRHASAHCFPSSVDVAHFRQARGHAIEPAEQAAIGRPRVGYAGVIDERIDLPLIDGVAAARPNVEIVLVGPIVKIDPATVPDRPNVHRLGMKPYADLPAYLAGWDVGWMPFARNDATRYISPTKTPEYLAAGLPVVSTSIHDVVEPYGVGGLVAIADSVEASVAAIDAALAGRHASTDQVDRFLATRSWDRTWAAMAEHVEAAAAGANRGRSARRQAPRRTVQRERLRIPTTVGVAPARLAAPVRAARSSAGAATSAPIGAGRADGE
ncbi:MAG TPA: glycosyltransferase [Candidatus Limnocylindrales bacterium]|nr:glycosyltransferase [Candidatus Limnocylindrales bacterium]